MADENIPVDTAHNEAQTAALTPVQEAAGMVRQYAAKLLNDDRAMQFATTLSIMSRQNAMLASSTKESLITAMMACVQLNLLPNTPEQHAFVIPYRNNSKGTVEVQFQIGYKGLIKLIHRGNQVKSIASELVFEGDKFKVKLGTNRQLVHEPVLDGDRTDYSKVTHAYATAVLANGEKVFEVMTRKELDKIRDSAKSNDGPWKTWPAEMAKKTVIKRFAKLLPSSSEQNDVALAAQLDSWAEASKLRYLEGGFVADESADAEASSEERKKRMAAAEAERKNLSEREFVPTPVVPQ